MLKVNNVLNSKTKDKNINRRHAVLQNNVSRLYPIITMGFKHAELRSAETNSIILSNYFMKDSALKQQSCFIGVFNGTFNKPFHTQPMRTHDEVV